jgi:hypothetical protein
LGTQDFERKRTIFTAQRETGHKIIRKKGEKSRKENRKRKGDEKCENNMKKEVKRKIYK